MAMSGICEQERKSSAATPRAKLARMLRSTLQRYPQARLLRKRGAFGASLGEGRYLQVSFSGELSAADLRDLLVLFATWLAADPDRILPNG